MPDKKYDYDDENYNLLIVESPTKAHTIEGYLKETEETWITKYTKGHIKNLPEREYGLKYTEGGVEADWKTISKEASKIIKEIKMLSWQADAIFIATDDDREGERIAADVLKEIAPGDREKVHRVVFREISKKEILGEIYRKVRGIDKNIVDAATANRMIDREIGYPISSIMSRHLKIDLKSLGIADTEENRKKYRPRGVGRVISPSLAIICERERQKEDFAVEKYFKVNIDYSIGGESFRVHNEKVFREEDTIYLERYIKKIRGSTHVLTDYQRKIEDVSAPTPLNTSTMQYSAWYTLQILPEDTMKKAQRLFELGLITYHRTDSIRMSRIVGKNVQELILDMLGEKYVAGEVRTYERKKKKGEDSNIQDAHECIRIVNFGREYFPKNIKNIMTEEGDRRYPLDAEELKLYYLIWGKTIMSQMSHAQYDRSVVEVTTYKASMDTLGDIFGGGDSQREKSNKTKEDTGGEERFICRGNERLFDGWEMVMDQMLQILAGENSGGEVWKKKIIKLPKDLKIGEKIVPLEVAQTEHETRAPKRYGVGTFIRTVSNIGIARPSTIGTLTKTLKDKGYIEITRESIYPTKLGIEVNSWTREHFGWLASIEHAKRFEAEIELIESGNASDFQDLVVQYHKMVREGAEKIGIDVEEVMSNVPSKKQIEYMRSIAKAKGVPLDESAMGDKAKAKAFISKHAPKKKKVKRCRFCRKGDIEKHDSYFRCNNQACDFLLTEKRVKSFFKNFGVDIGGEEELQEMVSNLLAVKGYECALVKKGGEKFMAIVWIRKDDTYGWGIDFKR